MDCFKIEEDKGLIRFFNALPSQESVDIYVDKKLLYTDIKYKDFTPYMYVETRPYNIDIYQSGTQNPIIRTTFRLPDENLFTLAITGNTGQETLIIVDDDIDQKTSNTQAISRFVNLSPDLPVADIFYNDKPIVDNIDYRDQTVYEYLNPGKYTVSVKENLSGSPLKIMDFEFKANRIYTIYIIGNPPNIDLIQSVDGNTYACPQQIYNKKWSCINLDIASFFYYIFIFSSYKNLTKFDSEKNKLNLSNIKLGELIKNIIYNFQGIALEKNINISSDIDDIVVCLNKEKYLS